MMNTRICVLYVLFLMICMPAHANNEQLKEDIYRARMNLIEAGQENRELKFELYNQESKITELQKELEKLEKQIENENES